MCAECTRDGAHSVCPSCRQRTQTTDFPFQRSAFRWGDLFGHSVRAYGKNIASVTLALLILVGPSVLLNILAMGIEFVAADVPLLGGLLLIAMGLAQFATQAFCTLLTFGLVLQVAEGRSPDLSRAIPSWGRLVAFFVLGLLVYALTVVTAAVAFGPILVAAYFSSGPPGFAALILGALFGGLGFVVFLYVMLGAVFAHFELAYAPDLGALDAFRNSWQIARSARKPILFGLMLQSALAFAGFLLCGIGVLFTFGLSLVFFATEYLTLRNGTPNLHGSPRAGA